MKLLAKPGGLLGPVRRALKPRECERKRGIGPAARNPSAVVDHAQRAQWLDQAQLASVEFAERLLAFQYGGELTLSSGPAFISIKQRLSCKISSFNGLICMYKRVLIHLGLTGCNF